MKKLLLSTMVLGSTIALTACGGVPTCNESLDNCDRTGPYTEERTIGTATNHVVAAPKAAMKSAEPVFESSQVK